MTNDNAISASAPHEIQQKENTYYFERFKAFLENTNQRSVAMEVLHNLLEKILEKNSERTTTVVDIGCGNGAILLPILNKHSDLNYIGIDNNQDLLSELKGKIPESLKEKVTLHNKNVFEDLKLEPCDDNTYIVILSHVLYYAGKNEGDIKSATLNFIKQFPENTVFIFMHAYHNSEMVSHRTKYNSDYSGTLKLSAEVLDAFQAQGNGFSFLLGSQLNFSGLDETKRQHLLEFILQAPKDKINTKSWEEYAKKADEYLKLQENTMLLWDTLQVYDKSQQLQLDTIKDVVKTHYGLEGPTEVPTATQNALAEGRVDLLLCIQSSLQSGTLTGNAPLSIEHVIVSKMKEGLVKSRVAKDLIRALYSKLGLERKEIKPTTSWLDELADFNPDVPQANDNEASSSNQPTEIIPTTSSVMEVSNTISGTISGAEPLWTQIPSTGTGTYQDFANLQSHTIHIKRQEKQKFAVTFKRGDGGIIKVYKKAVNLDGTCFDLFNDEPIFSIEFLDGVELQGTEELFIEHEHDFIDVPGDGNCFFHAVARTLNNDVPGTLLAAAMLREIAIRYIEDNRPQFRDAFTTAEPMDTYIERMRVNGEYAEGPIINALAHALNVNLEIVAAEETYNIPSPTTSGNPTITLGYNGNHYLATRNDEDNFKAEETCLNNFQNDFNITRFLNPHDLYDEKLEAQRQHFERTGEMLQTLRSEIGALERHYTITLQYPETFPERIIVEETQSRIGIETQQLQGYEVLVASLLGLLAAASHH